MSLLEEGAVGCGGGEQTGPAAGLPFSSVARSEEEEEEEEDGPIFPIFYAPPPPPPPAFSRMPNSPSARKHIGGGRCIAGCLGGSSPLLPLPPLPLSFFFLRGIRGMRSACLFPHEDGQEMICPRNRDGLDKSIDSHFATNILTWIIFMYGY